MAVTTPATTSDAPRHAHPGGPVYFACFTRRGDTPLDDIEAAFPPHKQWVADQEAAGRIVVAGPFLTRDMLWDGNGFLVFRVDSPDAAERLAAQDPMHERGLRTFEIVPWQLNEGAFHITLTFSGGGFEFT